MKILVILICIMLIPILSWTQDILKAGLFNIVPYAYYKNEKVIGITPDIIEGLKKESNLNIEMTLLPYKRMLYYLELGKIDFAVFFLSDYSAYFSEKLIPLYSLETIIIGKKGLVISSYKDLHNLTLATPLGVKYDKKLSDDKEINIFYVKDYQNAIGMLMKGYADAIIAPKKILSHQLKKAGININELGIPYILTKNTAWIQFSHKSKLQHHKKTLINSAQKLLDKGVIDEIIRSHYPK